MLVRILGNYLGWKGYIVLLTRFKEMELKRQNKLRYIELKKKIVNGAYEVVQERKV